MACRREGQGQTESTLQGYSEDSDVNILVCVWGWVGLFRKRESELKQVRALYYLARDCFLQRLKLLRRIAPSWPES